MKVIFLDIDGVLNNHQSIKAADDTKTTPKERALLKQVLGLYTNGYPKSVLLGDIKSFDKVCIQNLNKIIEVSSAKVVISSSWRNYHPLGALKSLLEFHGFQGELIGITPDLPSRPRGLEILKWIRTYEAMVEEVTNILILDDDTDMGPLRRYLVKTTMKRGLADKHVKKSLEVFSLPYPLLKGTL